MFTDPRVGQHPKRGKNMTVATTTQTVEPGKERDPTNTESLSIFRLLHYYLVEQRLIEAEDLRREILNDLQAWHQKHHPTKGGVSQEMHNAR